MFSFPFKTWSKKNLFFAIDPKYCFYKTVYALMLPGHFFKVFIKEICYVLNKKNLLKVFLYRHQGL